MAIKKILALFALFILSTPAFAQGFGSPNGVGFPSTSSGSGSSPLTTKGDVFTFSTVNTRLPVGTNGQLLSADSSQATGLKWITASGTGTVTSVSGLAPLFTTANSTTTPTFSLSNAAAHAFFGNNTGSTAAPSYVQPAFTDLSGQATFAQFPALSSGNIIVGNGSNVAASVAMSGDATISNGGAVSIANNAVTNAKAAQMAAHTYKGNNTGSTANAADITSTQLTADLNLFTTSLQGLAPASGGGTTNFLRADGTWAAPAGGGSSGITPATTDLRVPWAIRIDRFGTGNTAVTPYGIISPTQEGTVTKTVDTDGVYINYLSATTTFTGLDTSSATCNYNSLPRMWFRIKGVDTTALRFFAGNTAYGVGDPAGNDTAANTEGFRYNPAIDTGGTIRFYTTDSGGTATTTDTGVTFDTNPHTLCVDASNPASIKAYIDGVLKATHTTNLPTATTDTTWLCGVKPTSGTKNIKIGAVYGDNR